MDDQNKKPEEWNEFPFGPSDRKEDNGFRKESEDSYAEARREPDTYTYGPFGGTSAYSSSNDRLEPTVEQEQGPVEVVATSTSREYRPFTVSGGGGGSRGGWDGTKPKRTSFRAIFSAFMVGVVAVGGLMFAADRGNWFGNETYVSNASLQNAEVKAASTTVNNAADVVRPNNIAKIFEQSSPAVVKIETYAKVRTSTRGNSSLFDDPFFRQFFGDDGSGQGGSNGNNGNNGGNGTDGTDGSLQESGMGSGFIFDSTGYILTNQHVVADADKIEVTVIGHNKPFTAKLLGFSRDLDLAVLKIEGATFPTLKLGDSGSANMGDWVVAIGNPYGFDHTVTVGVLSANERQISIQDTEGQRNYEHLLQTDASINPGNSGGPLLNLNGEVIGINTAVSSEAQGIGFAIPTSTITDVLENLKSNTQIPKKPVPFIGAQLTAITSDIAKKLGIDTTKGSIVSNVVYGTPAYRGDLRQYDVITGMDGTSYNSPDVLIAAIQKKAIGDKVTLNVIRGGNKIDVKVEIGNKNDYEDVE